ncbi:aldose epimerase family protein [Paracoccus onubensis]|uniref:aldose epimerase family protein n=1 Tax=Paracoccus onubensis TaxID=1675788 RepID=UPI0027307003|nr:aldose epimerase family protein [Paracoccus onubensis]MDP0930137.1 aldose epimerase family protein [Paracoccus onubensis]
MSARTVCTLPDGRAVQSIEIGSGGLSARILTLGAIVQDLRLDGVGHPLVLGSPCIEDYLGPTRYFGAIAGRFANRIGGGRFYLDGKEYSTDRNFIGRHTLHGGHDGAAFQNWRITSVAPDKVSLTLHLPDGHMGFPGNLHVQADIGLTADSLIIGITAETDAATPCSFAHHGYFDLDGGGDIRNHSLMIHADTYLPTNDELIPTGRIAPVAGTPFDFRDLRGIGSAGYDHNFCLSDGPQPLRPVARLVGESGLGMRVETTACGLQLYDGAGIKGVAGLGGRIYGPWAGVALETQHWPDAPNRPGFPSAILRPDKRYSETTIYRFIQ